jgi:DNA replication protein DnaC
MAQCDDGMFGPFEKPAEATQPTERSENCDKHGEFTSYWFKTGQFWSTCPTCLEERRQRQEEALRQREHAERIARLLLDAAIPARFAKKGFEHFRVDSDEQHRVLETLRKYVAEFPANLRAGRCLILCGPVGTGKTHLACALLKELAHAVHEVRYATAAQIVRFLRETWRKDSRETEEEVIEWLARFELLVIDELGVQFGSDAERLQLFEVLNARYNKQRPTMLVGNVNGEDLKACIGERSVDRMRENGGLLLILSGVSWRAR